MGLKLYIVEKDNFELDESMEGLSFAFPCCVCAHRFGSDNEEPCLTCGHNANAQREG